MYITTTGLVLRETEYRETSKILTVFTAETGKITVSVKGARRRGSKLAAAAQLLAYSEMTLFSGGGRWTLTEARSLEQFRGLRDDVALLALGSYFAELMETLAPEEQAEPEMLALGLNALYVLASGKKQPTLVKAAFELRLMELAGLAPLTDGCAVCGRESPESPVLSLRGGVIYCAGCRPEGETAAVRLDTGSLAAMRHILHCDSRKLYAFSVSDAALTRLGKAAEQYVLSQLDRNFKTLDFYKKIRYFDGEKE